MYWVVQENLYNEEGFDSLIRALDVLALPYSIHKVIPFAGEIEPDVNPDGKVVVMGSISLNKLAQLRNWNPGVFTNENFDFMVQRDHWGNHMLNADATIYRFEDIPRHNKPFFLRPVHDTKAFPAKVYDWDELEEWRENVLHLFGVETPQVSSETLCVLTKPKDIYAEYRTWVIDRVVVAASKYKTGTLIAYDSMVPYNIVRYAEDVSEIWTPHRAFVLDICETEDGLKILEVNNLNSAGFYKGNVQRIVQGIEISFGG